MKIGRLIERNVFTFLWLFFFISSLLISLSKGGSFDEDATFFYCDCARQYTFWPQIFFRYVTGAYSLGLVSDVIFAYLISLISFIAADFLWRKIFWNEKKNRDTVSTDTLDKTQKSTVLQIAIWITKWAGRLLASVSIPFLMLTIEWSIYEMHCKESLSFFEPRFHLAGASLAILGCIIGWRFPLIALLCC